MLWGKLMFQQLTHIYDAISPSLYIKSNTETKDNWWLSCCVSKDVKKSRMKKGEAAMYF